MSDVRCPGLYLTHLWLGYAMDHNYDHHHHLFFILFIFFAACIHMPSVMSTAFNQSQWSRHKAHAQQVPVVDEWVSGSCESYSQNDGYGNGSPLICPCSKYNRVTCPAAWGRGQQQVVVVVATGHAFNPRTNKVIKDFTVIIKFDKAATASRVGIDSYILCIYGLYRGILVPTYM